TTFGSGARYCACPNGRFVFRDADSDGYGVAGVATPSCDGSIPTGYVTNDTDCDDIPSAPHPGGTEGCNGLDDDCDGIVDDGGSSLCSDADLCTTDACAGGACTFTPGGGQGVERSPAGARRGRG